MKRTQVSRPLLLPLVPLYHFGLALRELRLRRGWESTRRLRHPVISVGNLSTGGSGKTPFTIALARLLVSRGVQVDVLSRGYGRSSRLPLRVRLAGTAEEFGDEPLLIAREAGVPVYVAPQRFDAGVLAEQDLLRDLRNDPGKRITAVHILDDGFQHRQLARDIDVVLLSRDDLHDRLLPAGNLREPPVALRRAQVIAISVDQPELEGELKAMGWAGTIWRIRRRMDVPTVRGRVAAFCGIARPGQFFSGLREAGMQLAAQTAFRDHHAYTREDIQRLVSAGRKEGASALITTEKDRVRLGGLASEFPPELPLETARLEIEIEEEAGAIDRLLARLGGASLEASV